MSPWEAREHPAYKAMVVYTAPDGSIHIGWSRVFDIVAPAGTSEVDLEIMQEAVDRAMSEYDTKTMACIAHVRLNDYLVKRNIEAGEKSG